MRLVIPVTQSILIINYCPALQVVKEGNSIRKLVTANTTFAADLLVMAAG